MLNLRDRKISGEVVIVRDQKKNGRLFQLNLTAELETWLENSL